jgi:hypothetical protein
MKLKTLILCCFLFGCEATQPRFVDSYPMQASLEETHREIENKLHDLGWRVLPRIGPIGYITAVNNQTATMRDHLSIDLSISGHISLWIRTEIKIDHHWIAPDHVCDGYTWAREQQLLSRILSSR